MGITKLSALYEKSPTCVGTIALSSFTGCRIAIDAGTWMFSAWCSASKAYIGTADLLSSGDELPEDAEVETGKHWLRELRRFVNRFLYAGITPVFVLDGQAPQDKDQTKDLRKEVRDNDRIKLKELREQILQVDPLLRNEGMLIELRKKTCNAKVIPFPDTDVLPAILKAAGIPCLQATEEAERLCSALCREGWVSAVYSTDTDNLVHGCHFLLKKMVGEFFEYVELKKLVMGLGLTHESFVDLCIMAGCDYNKNMPRIAIGRSYPLINTYGSIDNLPGTFDIGCLRHERCRELFKHVPSKGLSADPVNDKTMNINRNALIEGKAVLENHSAEEWIKEINVLVPNVPPPRMQTTPYTVIVKPTLNVIQPRLNILS